LALLLIVNQAKPVMVSGVELWHQRVGQVPWEPDTKTPGAQGC
jgi:hypothetical protein